MHKDIHVFFLDEITLLARFTIPFTLATTMGLGALALDLPISMAEAEAGALLPSPSPLSLSPS